MPRVTTEQLANEIKIIKENHLYHLKEDLEEVKTEMKENRNFFQQRLDRLDNRVWAIMAIAVTTLVAIVVEKMI